MEGYTLSSIDALPAGATLKEQVRYPPNDVPGVVTTKIGLWEVETNVSSIFSWLYWKSFFTTIPNVTYHVTLQQEDLQQKARRISQYGPKEDTDLGQGHTPQATEPKIFILHKTEDFSESQTSFNLLKNTIEPLVDDCTLLLTLGLLKEIVLPQPVDPSTLPHHLTDVMANNPNAHPDWVKVMRALMLSAIGNDDAEGVDRLLNKVDFQTTDINKKSVLNRAASVGSVKVWKRIAKKVITQKDLFNTQSVYGKSLIQLAFKKNLPDIVMTMMMNSKMKLSDIRNEEGTVLHLAAEAGCEDAIATAHHKRKNYLTESFLEKKDFLDALNAVNNEGLTPLMVAVQKASVGTAVTLMQCGADLNIQHAETGDTALHFAAKQGLPSLVKAIIAFRANINIKNKAGKTALEEAWERLNPNECADQCVEALVETSQLMEEAKLELSKVSDADLLKLDPDSTVLLSLDGGGVRGLLTCQILISLHERMKQLQPDCAPIHKYFDYLSGVSLGGLLIISMVYSSVDPQNLIATFFKAASELLPKCPNCPKEAAEEFMLETMGSNHHLMMSDVQSPRVIIMTCRANEIPTELELICNYRQTSEKQWKAWEAGRATSAAPTYFPSHEHKFIDGGIMANNPTLEAMTEIFDQGEREGKDVNLGMVVSIGTGSAPKAENAGIDFFLPNTKDLTTSVLELHHTIRGVTKVFNILLGQATRSDGQKVQQATQWCKTLGTPYFRFSPSLSEPIDLAETKKGTLAELMYIGLLYTLRNAKQLDNVARMLLSRAPRAQ